MANAKADGNRMSIVGHIDLRNHPDARARPRVAVPKTHCDRVIAALPIDIDERSAVQI